MSNKLIGSTIVMSETDIHSLMLTSAQHGYEAAQAGMSWDAVRRKISDALVATTRPLSDEESKTLLGD